MQADGRSEQAEQFYRSAVESFSHVATDELPRVCREELADTHRQLAEICREQKRLAEAEHAARQAHDIARQMATAFPQRRPFLAELYVPLGIILTDLKELQEAEQVYRAALALYGDLKQLAPRQTGNAAVTLDKLGGILRVARRPRGSRAGFSRGARVVRRP